MATYCFSDLHGQYNLWTQIKDYIKSDDKVFCLGDCTDRGPYGIKILLEILDTPNIILLKGNHEEFITYIGSQLINNTNDPDLFDLLYLWYYNGGTDTVTVFNRLNKVDKLNLIKKINNLPTFFQYMNTQNQNIYLCHAGMQPDSLEVPDMHTGMIPMNNYLWDRSHMMDPIWNGKENEFCVHGHTPVSALNHNILNLKEELPQNKKKIFKYCNGHKIDIDLGSFKTHTACLLNLDTWEEIYVSDKEIA